MKISAGNVNENVTFPKLLSGLYFGQAACVTIKVTIRGFKVSSAFYLSHWHDLLTTRLIVVENVRRRWVKS